MSESQELNFDIKEQSKVQNRPVWQGNFNIWLALGTIYSLWFTCARGLPYFGRGIGPLFAVHLANACLISWIYIWNLFHTPSHGHTYKAVHVWLGRTGLLFGILSTILGLITVWYEEYKGVSVFAVAISIGGILQVTMQILAVVFIRRGNVKKHMIYNHVVFFGGCLIPGIMRFQDMINAEITPYWNTFSWFIPLLVGGLSVRSFLYKTWY